MIYLTAIGLPPGGSSTVHIYTQTTHRSHEKYVLKCTDHFFSFRNQQSEYLGALWADVLAVCRGEVPSSEEISVVDSVNCWLMYGSS